MSFSLGMLKQNAAYYLLYNFVDHTVDDDDQ